MTLNETESARDWRIKKRKHRMFLSEADKGRIKGKMGRKISDLGKKGEETENLKNK